MVVSGGANFCLTTFEGDHGIRSSRRRVWFGGNLSSFSLYGGTFRRRHDNISARDQKMYAEVVGVVAACDIMKWTTGVGVIGTRWVDPGEITQNCQILVRGNTETEKD
jgi:hypothetical protein